MSKFVTGLAMTAAVLAGGLIAAPALASKASESHPGVLHVFDNAKIFSAEGVKKAEAVMSGVTFDRGLNFTVDTYAKVPDDRRAEYEAVKGDAAKKRAFVDAWAKSMAKGDRAKGPYALICMEAAVVTVEVDVESKNRGFSHDNAVALAKTFETAMKESSNKPDAEKVAIRDAALVRATEYVVNDLKGTKVTNRDGSTPVGSNNTVARNPKAGGMSVGGWICLGLSILLGVWLVIGLIRALTGGGGGGGGGYGGGGGGGGGGFMSSMFGGLFGAMAGMWLYNNMFGHSGMMGGSDAYAGDASGGGNTDTGAGDYDGGTSASAGGEDGGGDWGGGGDTGGGGDWGGGGDAGGGGDWGGGGGGDFGGGGGDF